MAHFILLTRVSAQALHQPRSFTTLERHVSEHVAKACPGVQWIADYAVMGPYDYLDIFEAPDIETALKVSALVRSYGHAHTELWPAVQWPQFRNLLRGLSDQAAK